MDRMGKRIDDARKEFDALVSTRRHQLERPLKRIEELRTGKGSDAKMFPDQSEEDTEELQEEKR